jgi:hypothetical protein
MHIYTYIHIYMCAVGTSGPVMVQIENPTDKTVIFDVTVNNPDYFFLDPAEDCAGRLGRGGVQGGGGGSQVEKIRVFQRAASAHEEGRGRGGGMVELEPYSKRDVTVLYNPRSVAKDEHGSVKLVEILNRRDCVWYFYI